MRRQSVTFINRVYPPVRGATGRVLRDLARSFAKDGWNVTVITTGPETKKELDGPIRVLRTKSIPKGKTSFAYIMVWIKLFFLAFQQPRTDLIVTMTDPPLLVVAGRILSSLKKARHIHWCHDLFPDVMPALGYNLSRRTMTFLQKLNIKSMKTCDKIIVVGRCMAKYLTHHGMPPGKISVIPNWADFELVTKRSAAANNNSKKIIKSLAPDVSRPYKEQVQDQTGLKFRILYAGNIGHAHPMQTILEAAALLDKEHPEIEFVFAGDGPAFERLAEERTKRELNNIRLLPFQPLRNLKSLMESGDVHLISMQHEAEGLIVPCKFYSALAVQRPCILVGPENSEIARVIQDYKAGSIVPQGDAERLATTIKKYRFSSDDWFAAHEGAKEAGKNFVPKAPISAWIDRARRIVKEPRRIA